MPELINFPNITIISRIVISTGRARVTNYHICKYIAFTWPQHLHVEISKVRSKNFPPPKIFPIFFCSPQLFSFSQIFSHFFPQIFSKKFSPQNCHKRADVILSPSMICRHYPNSLPTQQFSASLKPLEHATKTLC